MNEIGQPGGYLGRLLGPLRKAGFPILENVLKPLAKSAIITLELTATSATNAAIYMKLFRSNMHPSDITKQTKVVISNEEINDIMKIISVLMNVVWIKGVSSTIKSEAKEQKLGFLRMLLGTLGASLLGNLLGGKGTIKAGEGTIRAVEDKIRAGQDFWSNLIL